MAGNCTDNFSPTDSEDQVQAALVEFGFAPEQGRQRSRPRKSKLDAARCKSLHTGHRVESVRSERRAVVGHEARIENLPDDAGSGFPIQYRSTRGWSGPFLAGLSGHDPLRVVRAGVANGGMDWLPYGWAR